MKMMKEMMKKEIANRFKEEEKKEREMIKRKIEEIQKLETVFKRKSMERQRKKEFSSMLLPVHLSYLNNLHNSQSFLPNQYYQHDSHSNGHHKANSNHGRSHIKTYNDKKSSQYHRREDSGKKKNINDENEFKNNSGGSKRSVSRLTSAKSMRHRASSSFSMAASPLPSYQKTDPKCPPCKVYLYYYGKKRKIKKEMNREESFGEYYDHNIGDNIKIEQQIREGTAIRVFNQNVKANSTFCFTSVRKTPNCFSFTIFIDDFRYYQVSTCCEHRYRKGSMIGGPSGHFRFIRAVGGETCLSCKEEKRLRRKGRASKSSNNNEGSYDLNSSVHAHKDNSNDPIRDNHQKDIPIHSYVNEDEATAAEDEMKHHNGNIFLNTFVNSGCQTVKSISNRSKREISIQVGEDDETEDERLDGDSLSDKLSNVHLIESLRSEVCLQDEPCRAMNQDEEENVVKIGKITGNIYSNSSSES